MPKSVTQKTAWSLAEIAASTGLSVGFLRGEVRRGVLITKKFGRRVLVLDIDFKRYLTQEDRGEQCLQYMEPAKQLP